MRDMVSILIGRRLSQRRSCDILKVDRSTMRYKPQPESPENAAVREALDRLREIEPRFGNPRATFLVDQNMRFTVNHKRVARIRREEGWQVPRKRGRKRIKTDWERPHEATRPNEVWSLDFLFERTQLGLQLKVLIIVDEFTRECLEIRVEKKMDHRHVMETLDELMQERGEPDFTRTDNGSEFIAEKLRRWLESKGVKPLAVEPGSPWQNGYVESFNGKFRDECLDQEMFYSRGEAQVVADRYMNRYNRERPHSSLGYLTPEVYAQTVIKTG